MEEIKKEDLAIDINTGYMYSNPEFLEIESTTRCNLNCIMCDHLYWRDYGHNFGDMELETFEKLIPFIKTAKIAFLSKIGEPLLAKNIMYMIKTCSELNCQTAFSTNGMLLIPEVSEQLIDNGLTEMEVSIDGIKSFYKIRGFKLDILISNLKQLNKLKVKKQSKTPRITFTFVAMKDNLKELKGVTNLAKELAVERIFVHPARIRYLCLKNQNVYKYRKEAIKIIQDCKNYAEKLKINLIPRRMTLIEDEGSRKSKDYICVSPFKRFFVDWQGNINVICCGDKDIFSQRKTTVNIDTYTSYNKLVNINKIPLDEIWNSPEYRKLRLGLLNQQPDEYCRRCNLIFGSLKTQVEIFDKDYVPLELKRFSAKLWRNNLEKVVESLKKIILAKDSKLKEKDRQLDEKNKECEERNRHLGERNGLLRIKDEELNKKDRQLEEKDKEIEIRDEWLEERGKELRDREKRLEEKDKEIEDRNRQLEEKDKQLKERDVQVQQTQDALNKILFQLQEREKHIQILLNSRLWKIFRKLHRIIKKLGMSIISNSIKKWLLKNDNPPKI